MDTFSATLSYVFTSVDLPPGEIPMKDVLACLVYSLLQRVRWISLCVCFGHDAQAYHVGGS